MRIMKKILICLVLITSTSFAAECWMNVPRKVISWHKPIELILNGRKYSNGNHTEETLNENGYYTINAPDVPISQMYIDYNNKVIYQKYFETTNEVVDIDVRTLGVANGFASLMIYYFGEDALTDRDVDEDAVTALFTAKVTDMTITALELAHSTLLKAYFEVLVTSPYNPSPGTTWDFPFGQTTVTNEVLRQYYIDSDDIKHYID